MINLKIVLKKKLLSDGKYPVCLRVTKERQCRHYKTPFSAKMDEWIEATGVFNKKHSNHVQNNRLLVKFKERAYQIITELEIENPDYTIQEFDTRFRVTYNPVTNDVFAFFDEIIQEMTFAGRVGNAKSYKDTQIYINNAHYFFKIQGTFKTFASQT